MGVNRRTTIKKAATKTSKKSKRFGKSGQPTFKKKSFGKKRFNDKKQSQFMKDRHFKAKQKKQESAIVSDDESDFETKYEKTHRPAKHVKVRNLLPVKGKEGFVYRSVPVEEKEKSSDEAESSNEEAQEEKSNLVEIYATQQQNLEGLKRKVALLSSSVLEDPENNSAALKELVTMLQNPTTQMIISERKILCTSLHRLFTDILPSYRIRQKEDGDGKVQLKKETRRLMAYEQSLLKLYKKYIELLYDLVKEMKQKANSESRIQRLASRKIGIVALKCLCELLHSRFSFNFFKDIANKLVPLTFDKDEKVIKMCCQAFEKLFRADKLGEASFGLIQHIVTVIKAKHFAVPIPVLRTFLRLNLREAKAEVKKVDMKKGRKEWKMMSRKDRHSKKKMKALEAELKETQAYESVESVKKFHTQTLKKIFWVFFHILKDGKKINLISPALEGISNFAYLINLEFFDDLNSVLCSMMDSGRLTEVDKLHGVYTLFSILAGQAESLHIDPHNVYCHLYQGLLDLNHTTSIEHFILTLKCLDFNIIRKRKKIPLNRILAFTKRIGSVCLQTPIHGTLGLLCMLKNILTNVTGSDILLDTETTLGSGNYLPEMVDPEHCNPQSTALWELQLLLKHYDPVIQLYARHCLNGCLNKGQFSLPEKLSKSTSEETLFMFGDVAVKNKMEFLEDSEEPPKKKIRLHSSGQCSFEDSIDLEIDSDVLNNLNMF